MATQSTASFSVRKQAVLIIGLSMTFFIIFMVMARQIGTQSPNSYTVSTEVLLDHCNCSCEPKRIMTPMKWSHQITKPEFLHPESPLAHRLLDDLDGIEIGAAAYAPFGLKRCRFVGLTEQIDSRDYNLFKDHQISVVGTFVPIDIPGDAENLSALKDSSVDYVLHSHVWEHLGNPLKGLEEWVRVVRHGGYIYALVPHRGALAYDVSRPLTSIQEMIQWQTQPSLEVIRNPRGHNTVFSPRLLFEIQEWYNRAHEAQLHVQEFQLWDDKIKLGHAIVWKVHKR
jgi:SAM-dependent methyltransferase